jgi:YHS domain-containing protein
MKLAAAGVHGMSVIDPVCGMTVDESKARAANRLSQHEGQTYYFCNEGCKKRFDEEPAKYLAKAESRSMAMAAPESKEATDLVCGMKVDEADAKAAKLTSEHQGKLYFFCNEGCKKKFEAEPAKYLGGAKAKPAAAMETQPARSKDPVCGMMVTEAKARAANRFSEHQGKTYFFCNDGCKQEFDAAPAKYLGSVKPK